MSKIMQLGFDINIQCQNMNNNYYIPTDSLAKNILLVNGLYRYITSIITAS